MDGGAGNVSNRSLPAEPTDSAKRGNPMAMLVERAGGAATAGYQRTLELQPEKLHRDAGFPWPEQ